jgi:hypothetical protein
MISNLVARTRSAKSSISHLPERQVAIVAFSYLFNDLREWAAFSECIDNFESPGSKMKPRVPGWVVAGNAAEAIKKLKQPKLLEASLWGIPSKRTAHRTRLRRRIYRSKLREISPGRFRCMNSAAWKLSLRQRFDPPRP